MSEAFLVNHGGLRFKKLRVPVLPEKTTLLYFNETLFDNADMAGAKIVADIGKSEVTLTPDNYTYEFNILSDTTAEYLIEATIGGTTRQVSIPLVLQGPDPILDNNSWEVISKVSAAGFAGEFWSVGDIKTETIDGTMKNFRIIGLDHDYLDSSDERYSDTSYNQSAYSDGKRYAGITFQTTGEWSSEGSKMNTIITNAGGWLTSEMRTTTMPAVYDSFTDDMKAVIRTVNKRTGCYNASSDRDVMTDCADKVFILAEKEILNVISGYHKAPLNEVNELTQYEWYVNHQSDCLSDKKDEWLRSAHDKNACPDHRHYLVARGNSADQLTTFFEDTNVKQAYRPAFCV